jgi:hypothetical protein
VPLQNSPVAEAVQVSRHIDDSLVVGGGTSMTLVELRNPVEL